MEKNFIEQNNKIFDISDCFQKSDEGYVVAMGELIYVPELKKVCFQFSPNGKDCIDLNDFPKFDI